MARGLVLLRDGVVYCLACPGNGCKLNLYVLKLSYMDQRCEIGGQFGTELKGHFQRNFHLEWNWGESSTGISNQPS